VNGGLRIVPRHTEMRLESRVIRRSPWVAWIVERHGTSHRAHRWAEDHHDARFGLYRIPRTLAALAALGTGCPSEDYYCDSTGCYYCDGLGCRPIDPPSRPPCVGDYECPTGTICTDLGCVAECSSDADCPMGTICRAGSCVGPTEPTPTPTPGECTTTADCLASGLICVDGVCTPEESACRADTDCGGGELCIDGECRADDETCQCAALAASA
jgi:hypothetical protein